MKKLLLLLFLISIVSFAHDETHREMEENKVFENPVKETDAQVDKELMLQEENREEAENKDAEWEAEDIQHDNHKN